jgi:hypothetical protein
MTASEYKARGGDYTTPKDEKKPSQKNLDKWTDEEWQTKEGSGTAKQDDGSRKRYLPKKAWEELDEDEKEATEEKKAEGGKEGKQFVGNTAEAKRKRRDISKGDEKKDHQKGEESGEDEDEEEADGEDEGEEEEGGEDAEGDQILEDEDDEEEDDEEEGNGQNEDDENAEDEEDEEEDHEAQAKGEESAAADTPEGEQPDSKRRKKAQ